MRRRPVARRPGTQWRATGGNAGRSGEPLAPVHTDWLRDQLTGNGPAGEVARLRSAARNTDSIRRHLDREEQWLLVPMAGQGPEARALAGKLRGIIAARHDRVLARWPELGGCPSIRTV